MIIENSIESRILQLQEKKKALFQSTVGKDMAALAKVIKFENRRTKLIILFNSCQKMIYSFCLFFNGMPLMYWLVIGCPILLLCSLLLKYILYFVYVIKSISLLRIENSWFKNSNLKFIQPEVISPLAFKTKVNDVLLIC